MKFSNVSLEEKVAFLERIVEELNSLASLERFRVFLVQDLKDDAEACVPLRSATIVYSSKPPLPDCIAVLGKGFSHNCICHPVGNLWSAEIENDPWGEMLLLSFKHDGRGRARTLRFRVMELTDCAFKRFAQFLEQPS